MVPCRPSTNICLSNLARLLSYQWQVFQLVGFILLLLPSTDSLDLNCLFCRTVNNLLDMVGQIYNHILYK